MMEGGKTHPEVHPERNIQRQLRQGEVQNDDDTSPFRIAAGSVFKFTAQREGAQDRPLGGPAATYPIQNILCK